MKKIFKVTSNVFQYPGMVGWYFLSVSEKESQEITKSFGQFKKGWGSLPVMATLGKTKWKTSIFPDKRSGTYLLPLKAAVRKSEDVHVKETVSFSIEVLV